MYLLKGLITELEQFGVRFDLIQPGSPELGSDLAMPCFVLAKEQKTDPQALASQIAGRIDHPAIKKSQAVKGYVNLWLKTGFLVRTLSDALEKRTPIGQLEANGRRVIIEYFSPNLAKPLSVGHLRNLFQGRALVNLFKVRGFEVITDNHIGDWGKVFGMWVVGYLKYGQPERLEKDGILELGRIYVAIQKALGDEKSQNKTDLEDQIQAWLLKLERGDKKAWKYHKLFSQISYQAMEEALDDLNISFDENLGESFYHQDQNSLKLLQKLEKVGIVQRQADSSRIVDLREYGIETPLLVQKSNGARLYSTSDIATLDYRQRRWQPDYIIHVVGFEQKFYFRQLFAFNQKARLTKARLIHYDYGLVEEVVDGKRQKMSSRKQAVYLKDVLDQAYRKAHDLNKDKLDEQDIKRIAQGALVFKEFCQGRRHNIVFNWDKIFSLAEMSGPYVQYAAVRLQSILDKTKLDNFDPDPDYDWQAEHQLILKLLVFEDVMRDALESLELNKIALHIFEFARLLNRYYEQTVVLDDILAVQSSRLWLLKAVYGHLDFALGALGIKIPSRM